MAQNKKPSGLGRGLGDLLEDNTPTVKRSGHVVIRTESGQKGMAGKPADLHDNNKKPKNKSLKANYR